MAAETEPSPAGDRRVNSQTVRAVTRCPKCSLNQFDTRNGKCRKCGTELHPPPEPEPAPAVLVDMNLPVLANGTPIDLASTIKLLRLTMRMSQSDLARRLHCPRTYISKVERGHNIPNVATIYKFEKALGVPAWIIITFATFASQS